MQNMPHMQITRQFFWRQKHIFCPTKIWNELQKNDVLKWHTFLLNYLKAFVNPLTQG